MANLARMSSSSSDTPAGAFDKLLILVGIIAAGAMVLAVFAVAGAGGNGGDSADSSGAGPQTISYELTEFAIDGDTEIDAVSMMVPLPTPLGMGLAGMGALAFGVRRRRNL